MKPPKCRLCGEAHWNNESHVFKSVANAVSGVANKESSGSVKGAMEWKGDGIARVTAENRTGETPDPWANSKRVEKWRGANRERYNARMRDYMRLRRAQG